MKMLNPDETELNVIFALEIAGWTLTTAGGMFLVDPKDGLIHNVPDFVKSVDAVIPLLENYICEITRCPTTLNWTVRLSGYSKESGSAFDESFPRACVLALLKAHGVEVEFAQ